MYYDTPSCGRWSLVNIMRILKFLLILILSFSISVIPCFAWSIDVPNTMPVGYSYFDYDLWEDVISHQSSDLYTYFPLFQLNYSDRTEFYYYPATNSSIPSYYFDFSNDILHSYTDSSLTTPFSFTHRNFVYYPRTQGYGVGSGAYSNEKDLVDVVSVGLVDEYYIENYINGGLELDGPSFQGWSVNDIHVPAGCALIVDRRPHGELVDLPVHAQLKSLVSVKKPLFGAWRNGASFGYSTTLLGISSIQNLQASNNITWARSANGSNYAGAQADFDSQNSRFWYLVNPLYYVDGGTKYTNNEIVVNFQNVIGGQPVSFAGTYFLAYLTATVNDDAPNGFDSVYNENNTLDVWFGSVDNDGNVILDDDGYPVSQGWKSTEDLDAMREAIENGDPVNDYVGQSTVPPRGGMNAGSVDVSDSSSTVELNLIQKIEGLFDRGSSSIDNVVSGGQGFFGFLSSLWSWLPDDVMSVVSSVLIIFLIVGAVKLFL